MLHQTIRRTPTDLRRRPDRRIFPFRTRKTKADGHAPTRLLVSSRAEPAAHQEETRRTKNDPETHHVTLEGSRDRGREEGEIYSQSSSSPEVGVGVAFLVVVGLRVLVTRRVEVQTLVDVRWTSFLVLVTKYGRCAKSFCQSRSRVQVGR